MNYKILIVDDEPANLRILDRLFRSEHTVITAESGTEALELLAMHDFAVIISDQRMPAMTGIDFLKKAAEMRPQTVRIILTGYTDINALVEAINSGVVYKYVSKPWVNEDLRQTVTRALQHYETVKTQHQLGMQNTRLHSRLNATLESFVNVLVHMLDLKEPHLSEHARRVSEYSKAIGRRLYLQSEELENLHRAAMLHDFAPPAAIQHSTHLTPQNQFENRKSPVNFERELDLLAGIPDLEDAVSAIRSLHEQYDGNGLPNGLAGDQIPLTARIIAVADAYEQMTHSPASQQNLTPDEAKLYLQSSAGVKFDPEIVKLFCELN